MHSSRRAFTLIELLVVIAIIAILAAILFPVFAQAKEAAKKTQAISNFKQTGTSMAMYMGDYDDAHPLSNSGSIGGIGWGYGPPDTVPDQQMAPYKKNTRINIDPMDPWQSEDQRLADHCPYMGCTVPTANAEQRAYALGVRSNIGYNYAFFSPWVYRWSTTNYVGSLSTNGGQVGNPANTLMWGTSIWWRDPGSGAPTGGGNWVIETPCWLDINGNRLNNDPDLYSYGNGWNSNANEWNIYGGLWPFYNSKSLSNISPGLKDGNVVVGFADTHVKSRSVLSTTAGCQAWGTGAFAGTVQDKEVFIWDFE